jgi:hypothetical protein
MDLIEVLRDDETEHRIPEEFEPFVRRRVRMLGAVGTVRDGDPEQCRRESAEDLGQPCSTVGRRAAQIAQSASIFAVT